ncbi:hypothetical protein HPP92_026757 [Vanilla planifolia]|uniref:GPI mannosyltransferase 2 n=1 Tax=Vanilla planifolia TaxID=51239 RepID=A0A835PEY1_VANPL|nr:hypothetical protein HPP92_026757 [Vanilla planifolia]
MQEAERSVLRLAILSRFLLLTLIITWRSLFPPYDSSAHLNPSCLSSTLDASLAEPADVVLWPRVGAAIEGSVVWDGVYFVRIAECGYEYEQSYAFLPLLPISMALLSRSVFAPLIRVIGYRAVLALSGYALNNLAFVVAAIYFYRLSILILKDSRASFLASALFCFNPASIFYSSVYSESLYALSSLCGLFYLFFGSNAMSMLLLCVSGAARSNGAINAGYICFMSLLQSYDAIIQKKSAKLAVLPIVAGVARSICLFIPFAAFQAYGYYDICLFVTSDDLRPWCKSRAPNLYGYLQSHYWGVGFMRYFQVNQLPNFLLASPILSIATASIICYGDFLRQYLQPLRKRACMATDSMPCQLESERLFSGSNSSSKMLKGNQINKRKKTVIKARSFENFHDMKLEMDAFVKVQEGYCSVLVFPFILHLGFLTFMAFFVMHVQVATRFLSASPPLYWFASYVMLSSGTTSRRLGYVIWSYFIAYILLGSLLFSNFYPFT